MNDSTVRHDYDDAGAFLAALLPTSEVWNPSTLRQFIFRGHADASWALRPSALRKAELTNGAQRLRELVALQRFWKEADRQGLTIPGDSLETRELWINSTSPGLVGAEVLRMAGRTQLADKLAAWPPKELWQALAVAQHHRVQTRLFDWTRLPTVAAYFAALGAAERLDRGESSTTRLGVWGCHENILIVSGWLEPELQFLHLVTVPRGGNPNLHAQHGVFTLWMPAGTQRDPPDKDSVEAIPFDQAVQRVDAIWRQEGNIFSYLAGVTAPHLRLLTLPTKEAPRLLDLLDMLGLSGATMRPGFDGAAAAVNEYALRERLQTGDS